MEDPPRLIHEEVMRADVIRDNVECGPIYKRTPHDRLKSDDVPERTACTNRREPDAEIVGISWVGFVKNLNLISIIENQNSTEIDNIIM